METMKPHIVVIFSKILLDWYIRDGTAILTEIKAIESEVTQKVLILFALLGLPLLC